MVSNVHVHQPDCDEHLQPSHGCPLNKSFYCTNTNLKQLFPSLQQSTFKLRKFVFCSEGDKPRRLCASYLAALKLLKNRQCNALD